MFDFIGGGAVIDQGPLRERRLVAVEMYEPQDRATFLDSFPPERKWFFDSRPHVISLAQFGPL
ncbi:MAG: hypothetical protein ABSD56_00255 [Bryobacteraceae bacterium]